MMDRDKTLNAMRMVFHKTMMYIKVNCEKEFKQAFKSQSINQEKWDELFNNLELVYNFKIEKELKKK